MDELHFDTLARALASSVTRRRTVAGLLAGVVPAAVIIEEVDASRRPGKRKRRRGRKSENRHAGHTGHHAAVGSERKKRKKKKKPQPTTLPPTTPPPASQPPVSCSGGMTNCGGVCVDTASNAQHCGACGQLCAAGETCDSGACGLVCGAANFCTASGSTPDCCVDTCTDISSDVQHCGGCGDACSVQASNQCVGGACQCGALAPCGASATCCAGGGAGAGACLTLDTDVNNCGTCGNLCPGTGQATATVGCAGSQCSFACNGANYDIDGNMATGCEQLDTQTNCTQATALFLGSKTCDDTDSRGTFTGTIYTDGRARTLSPAGYDQSTKAAPLWYRVFGDGGAFCQNTAALSVSVTGGTNNCYEIAIVANNVAHTSPITGGSASIALGVGSYDDDTNVYFHIAKTCTTALRESPTFSASYHL